MYIRFGVLVSTWYGFFCWFMQPPLIKVWLSMSCLKQGWISSISRRGAEVNKEARTVRLFCASVPLASGLQVLVNDWLEWAASDQ